MVLSKKHFFGLYVSIFAIACGIRYQLYDAHDWSVRQTSFGLDAQLASLTTYLLSYLPAICVILLLALCVHGLAQTIQYFCEKNSKRLHQAQAQIEQLGISDPIERFSIYSQFQVNYLLPLAGFITRLVCAILIIRFMVLLVPLPEVFNSVFYGNLICAAFFVIKFHYLDKAQKISAPGIINILLIVLSLTLMHSAVAIFIACVMGLHKLQELNAKQGKHHVQI